VSFLDRVGIPVTPLLCAGAALAIGVTSVGWFSAAMQRDTARAERDSVMVVRDAFASRLGELQTANDGYGAVLETMRAELRAEQAERRRMDEEGRAAVLAAEAETRDAERTLAAFAAKFQTESRRPKCQQALADMEAQCAALAGY